MSDHQPPYRVWIVADRVAWEGDHPRSVHATRESAEREVASLPYPGGEWVILEYEVKP